MVTRSPPLKLLLVEDDIDVAGGLGEFLEAHDLVVDFAYNGTQAEALLAEQRFDVLVLDVNLPGTNGIALCREWKSARGLTAPVLFLTARGNLEDKLSGFDAGATDYMVKPFEPAELLARVRAIAAHHGQGRGLCLHIGEYRLDLNGRTLVRGRQHVPLHPSAYTILRKLMEAYPGNVRREELSEALWDGSPPDSDPLRAHVHQLRRLFLERFGARLIDTVRGVGYRFEAES